MPKMNKIMRKKMKKKNKQMKKNRCLRNRGTAGRGNRPACPPAGDACQTTAADLPRISPAASVLDERERSNLLALTSSAPRSVSTLLRPASFEASGFAPQRHPRGAGCSFLCATGGIEARARWCERRKDEGRSVCLCAHTTCC